MADEAQSAVDQQYKSYGAKLQNPDRPGDDDTDTAHYIMRPGIDFLRPWVAIRNGAAFQWPIGLQGFTVTIDPSLGIHKFIGDNAVSVDVIHRGEEHLTMTGHFPGKTSPDNFQTLRDIVYADAPPEGKLLYIPFLMTHVQRVVIARAEFSRADDDRGFDMNYSLDFVRTGVAGTVASPAPPPPVAPGGPAKGPSSRSLKADSVHNTLRKIALWKYGGANEWRKLYNLNAKWFMKRSIPIAQAPTHRLPVGTVVYY